MHQQIIDDIPFELNIDALMKKLHVKPGSEYEADLKKLAREAERVARPKAFYRIGQIESRGEDTVVINGVTLKSRVLSVNLEKVNRVFALVATCGTEIVQWAEPIDDMLEKYWVDAIMEKALRSAINAVKGHIKDRYNMEKIATMNPGSLPDWPIYQQKPLFEIIGDTQKAVGVELLDSMLMSPVKTVSEILFQNDENYKNCQLCPMENCPSRKGKYDSALYEKKYGAQHDL
jgi:hypothetical protein